MLKKFRHSLPFLLRGAVGFGAGALNGLLGAAGGVWLVAVLPYLPPLPSPRDGFNPPTDRRDVLATVLCVMLPVSAVSFFSYLLNGIRPSLASITVILLPAAVGGFLGAFLLDRIPRKALQQGFGLMVLISGLRMLLG